MLKLLPTRFEIELSSHCNRNCRWCTNQFTDRLVNHSTMDSSTLKSFLSQLKDVNWEGQFSLSHYNEPLAESETLRNGIETIKEFFPHTQLAFNSNGDFLTKERLEGVRVDSILVSDYDEQGIKLFNRIKEEMGLFDISIPGRQNTGIFTHKNGYQTKIVFNLHWSTRNGNNLEDRANMLPEQIVHPQGFDMGFKNDRAKRNYPCNVPYGFNSLEYNGNIMPCCHYRGDIKELETFILGNINVSTLEEIYTSDKVRKFREDALSSNFNSFCSRCHKPSRSDYDNFYELKY